MIILKSVKKEKNNINILEDYQKMDKEKFIEELEVCEAE